MWTQTPLFSEAPHPASAGSGCIIIGDGTFSYGYQYWGIDKLLARQSDGRLTYRAPVLICTMSDVSQDTAEGVHRARTCLCVAPFVIDALDTEATRRELPD